MIYSFINFFILAGFNHNFIKQKLTKEGMVKICMIQ